MTGLKRPLFHRVVVIAVIGKRRALRSRGPRNLRKESLHMSTNFVSLLPFLKALQRNQNMPDDDDDSTPPVDQFGRVLPSQGNGVPPQSANTGRSGDPGVAPGASQSNLAQTDALQNYQGQSNSIRRPCLPHDARHASPAYAAFAGRNLSQPANSGRFGEPAEQQTESGASDK